MKPRDVDRVRWIPRECVLTRVERYGKPVAAAVIAARVANEFIARMVRHA